MSPEKEFLAATNVARAMVESEQQPGSGLSVGSEVSIPKPAEDGMGKGSMETWAVTDVTNIDGEKMAVIQSPTGEEALIPAGSPAKGQGVVWYDLGFFDKVRELKGLSEAQTLPIDIITPQTETDLLKEELGSLMTQVVSDEDKRFVLKYAMVDSPALEARALNNISEPVKTLGIPERYKELIQRINAEGDK